MSDPLYLMHFEPSALLEEAGPLDFAPVSVGTVTSNVDCVVGSGSLDLHAGGEVRMNATVGLVTPGASDFAVSFWYKPDVGLAEGQPICGMWPNGATTGFGWLLTHGINDVSSVNNLRAIISADGNYNGNTQDVYGAIALLVPATWNHVVFGRKESQWFFAVNGVRAPTAIRAGPNTPGVSIFPGPPWGLQVGYSTPALLDELAFWPRECPYPNAFTPSTAALSPAALPPLTLLGGIFRTATPEFMGRGRIANVVDIASTPDNVPVHRKVLLVQERGQRLVAETWSDPVTGAYSFDNLDEAQRYTVIAYDYPHNYRAVIADNLTPDPMP